MADDRDQFLKLAREVTAVATRLDNLSDQIADFKSYMRSKFDKQEEAAREEKRVRQNFEREAEKKQETINTEHAKKIEALEKMNTFRAGKVAMAIGLGGLIGYLLPVGNFFLSIYDKIKGGP